MPLRPTPRWIRMLGWHVRALVVMYLLEGWVGGIVVERYTDTFAMVAAIWRDHLDGPLATPDYAWGLWIACAAICAVGVAAELVGWRIGRAGGPRGAAVVLAGVAIAHLAGLASALVPWIQLLRIWAAA